MKRRALFRARTAGFAAGIVCAAVWASYPLHAGVNADGTAPPDAKSVPGVEEQPPEYKNWIEFELGGTTVDGDRAQFQQEHRLPGDKMFGGISDLHFEEAISKDLDFKLDGHALFDTNDYGLLMQLTKAKLGYVQVGYNEFRSWYDGNGGFFRPNSQWFEPPRADMHVDRGEAWIELGLRAPNLPEITVRYTHEFRDGDKDSTIWGDTNLTGIGATRKIAPSFRNIDEQRDIFTFDLSQTIANTDINLGMRYEHDTNSDSLNFARSLGQLPPAVPPPGQQRFFSQHQDDEVDIYSGHAIAVTRFDDSLWFTAGYSYTTMQNDLAGSRLPGTSYANIALGEPVPTLGQRDHSFIALSGLAEVDQHVINANVFWMPIKDLDIVGGFRYTHETRDSDSTFLDLEPEANVAPFTTNNPAGGFHLGSGTLGAGMRSSDYDRFAESVELRYAGLADWLFYARAEWEEESGSVNESQAPDEDVPLNKDTNFLGQKYQIGMNWYPLMNLNFSGQYYHKIASYGDDINTASFPRLINQDWNTDDANVRITFRPKIPVGALSLVTRYDFVRTHIDGQWEVFSDGTLLNEMQTGVITKHVISESLNWSPEPRFYLQGDISLVLDQTDTPASSIVFDPHVGPTVVNFRNDYWAATASVGYIINDKTDVHAEYSYFRANDYFNNSGAAVPYGLGATEHVASATLTRQITRAVRLKLQYTFYDYTDQTFGGHNNYMASSFLSTLQFRF